MMNQMKSTYRKNIGATLLELVLVIVLVAILGASGGYILTMGFNSYEFANQLMEADWNGIVATSRINQDLHALYSANDITTATDSTLVFKDISGNTITYSRTSSDSTLRRNSLILADNISSLAFTYYNGSGTALTNPIVINNIRYIAMTFNVTVNSTTTIPFRVGISLWNVI